MRTKKVSGAKAVAFLPLLLVSPFAQAELSESDMHLLEDSAFCVGPSISPGGDYLTFISNRTGPVRLWRGTPDGSEEPVAFSIEGQPRKAIWNPERDLLAVEYAPGGSDRYGVLLIGPDGNRRIVSGTDNVTRLYKWSRDGKHLYLTSNRDVSSELSAYRYSLEGGAWTRLTEGKSFDNVEDASIDGKHLLIWRLAQASDEELLLLDIESGALQSVIPPGSEGGVISAAQFDADGRILVATNRYSDLAALMSIDPETGKATKVASRDNAELDYFSLSPDGSRILAHWNQAGRSQLEILDANSFEIETVIPFGAGVTYRWRWQPDGKGVVFQLVNTRGNNVWRYDLESAELFQMSDCGNGGSELHEPRLVTFDSFDGEEISGWLYRTPDMKGPTPLVIQLHGGPEGQSRPLPNGFYEVLNRKGIAVFAVNVRGSIGFGRRFEEMDNGRKRWGAIHDVSAARKALIELGVASPERVAVMGRSYGGFLTMAAVAFHPDEFKAAVNMYGGTALSRPSDNSESGWHAHLNQAEYGDPETHSNFFKEISPLSHFDQVRAPVLFLHGANDRNSPLEYAEYAHRALQKHGVISRLVVFPDEGHGFVNKANQVTMVREVVTWFEKHLLGEGVTREMPLRN